MLHNFSLRTMIFLVLSLPVILTGCDEKDRKGLAQLVSAIRSGIEQSFPQKNISWHKKYRLEADLFFDNPKVIALCKAIEAKDLKEIDHLIADGTDVNAKGKGNWTPLLWAYFAKDLEVFTKILEAGANPNVQLTEVADQFYRRFAVPECKIDAGMSVTEIAAMSFTPGFFEAVMEHGGDPKWVSKTEETATAGNTLLHSIALWRGKASDNVVEHAKLLLDGGADINAVAFRGTPITLAVQSGRYDLAVFLLEAGADWEIEPKFRPDFPSSTLLYLVVQRMERTPNVATRGESFDKLVLLLKEKGADFENEREYQRLKAMDIARMNIESARPILKEIARLEQERIERYKRYEQKKQQKVNEGVLNIDP